jgi:serine/threonine protein kinase
MTGNDSHLRRMIAGRYQVLRELGHGGMGTVWLADDTLAGRQVAVKELRPPPGLSEGDRDEVTRRALREARSVARIRHPNAVTLYDVLPATSTDDAVYLIMEFIDGPTLAQLIRRNGSLSDQTVAALGMQLLDVLAEAHKQRIVHRDIKPGNIMLTADGQAKLTDFGIARADGDTTLTHGWIGTQAYMAPEQFDSQTITPAADLWSLGATLYAASDGHGPFDRDTTAATLHAVLFGDIPLPHCSASLAAAITGMLQRDLRQRATISQARTMLQKATGPTTDSSLSRDPHKGQQWEDAETRGAPRDPDLISEQPPTQVFSYKSPVPSWLQKAFAIIPFLGFILGLGEINSHNYYLSEVIAIFASSFALLIGLLAFESIFADLMNGRILVFDPRGFTIRRPDSQHGARPVAEVRWDQVARIAPLGRPPRVRLCAWISKGDSKPARVIRLCPVGSPHFPIRAVLTAIQSYCPTVTIDSNARALADSQRR